VTINLGDLVHRALALVQITPERVEAWLGEPCHCAERQEKLNRLGWWALRVTTGWARGQRARQSLEGLISQEDSGVH
jgi:hypothetical protein